MPEGEPLTILLVEDDPVDAALFKALLGHTPSFRQEHASSLAEAREQLTGGGIDLVVLDLGLPDSPSEDTYRRVRALAPDVPVIVLTANDDDDAAYDALAAGAQDYLVKNAVTETLLAKSIRYAVERHTAIRRQRRHRSQELEVYASLAPERAGHAPASPLAETSPDEFELAVRVYDQLLDLAVQGGYDTTEAELTVQINGLAARLADLAATPPDLGAIHASTLGARQAGTDPDTFALYEDVARLVLLHLTGELANQYRQRLELAGGAAARTPAQPLPADARDRLVHALGELLGRRPLDAITLDHLAEEADLPPSSVRAAVSSVREPLAALLQQEQVTQRERVSAELAAATAAIEDEAGAVRVIVDVLVDLWRTGRVITLAAIAASGDETIQALRYRHLRSIALQSLEVLGPHLDRSSGPTGRREAELALAELMAVLDQKLILGELFPLDQTREQVLHEIATRVAARLGDTAGAEPSAGDLSVPAPSPEGDGAMAANGEEAADEPPARLTGADYTAWADRMRNRRRSEIDSLYDDDTPVRAQPDPRWSPDALFKTED